MRHTELVDENLHLSISRYSVGKIKLRPTLLPEKEMRYILVKLRAGNKESKIRKSRCFSSYSAKISTAQIRPWLCNRWLRFKCATWNVIHYHDAILEQVQLTVNYNYYYVKIYQGSLSRYTRDLWARRYKPQGNKRVFTEWEASNAVISSNSGTYFCSIWWSNVGPV